MDILLARIFGIVLMVVYGGVLLNLKFFRPYWSDLSRQPLILFLSGFIALVFGLVTLNLHNVWAFDWRGVITLLGWLLVVNGAWRLLFPQNALQVTEKFTQNNDGVIYTVAGVMFAVGVYLTLVGYAFI